jgi:hypothetical protein
MRCAVGRLEGSLARQLQQQADNIANLCAEFSCADSMQRSRLQHATPYDEQHPEQDWFRTLKQNYSTIVCRSLLHQQPVVAGHALRHQWPQVAQADQLKELTIVQLPASNNTHQCTLADVREAEHNKLHAVQLAAAADGGHHHHGGAAEQSGIRGMSIQKQVVQADQSKSS